MPTLQAWWPSSSTTAALLLLFFAHSIQAQAPAVYNNTQSLTGFPPVRILLFIRGQTRRDIHNPANFIQCDALLSSNLSHAVYMPSSAEYPALVNGSWSLNARSESWCFVLPSTKSEAVQIITALQSAGDGAGDWAAAIRGGGHGSDDSNNILNGVTIDMSRLNTTTYDATNNVAKIDAGSLWMDVYVALQKEGVSVTGGREGVVGVGGFVLGGGNSFYTSRTGFSCDTVVNYEVVLANGDIINANASSHADLWRALKGGGSNFGIVTRFDMETFPAKNLTLETRVIGPEHSTAVADATVEFSNLDQSFAENAMLTMMMYRPDAGLIMQVIEVNTVNDADTTAFDTFNAIPTMAPSHKQSMNLVDVANRSEVPDGTL